ncbi:hypothetical protein ABZY14_06610 [Streptomyces sp. NPDC006617]|uniref:hypothetical protein n=1 Tax=Streptomyces sp. NPDC006617 TaxID=3155354 RepID=UPI0033A46EA6
MGVNAPFPAGGCEDAVFLLTALAVFLGRPPSIAQVLLSDLLRWALIGSSLLSEDLEPC